MIHRILHPSPQPLRADPNELNTHFASTAERVTVPTTSPVDELWNLIDSFPDDDGMVFYLPLVKRC